MSQRLRLFKSVVDLVFIVAVIALSWLLVLVGIAVRLTSKGPGLFWQDRIGQDGTPFRCVKFRTMQQGTDQKGTHLVNQSSVTPLGRILRATKIDELPQAWNVLRRTCL